MLEGKPINQGGVAPFFSIIITTYNRAALLKRALDSLLNQIETDWELILIDDGSTDHTPMVLQSYRNKFEQITLIRQENSGVIAAKNRGISTARGRYITFLDSDDEYQTMHLTTRKKLLLKHLNIDLLHGGFEIIGSQYVPDRFDHHKKIHLKECVASGTFFIKREVAIALNGFSKTILKQDGDFMDRAMKAKLNILKTEIPTYVYHREAESSITNDAMRKQKCP